MNKAHILDDLVLKLEYNKDQQSRIESLQTLIELDLLNTDHINFLEDLAIGDTNINIKRLALNILINQFHEKVGLLIEWILQFEQSPRILTTVTGRLSKKNQDLLKLQIIKFLDEKVKDNRNLSLKNYNKELSKWFEYKPLDSLSSKELINIYLNYKFIVNLEKQFKFSKNLNSRMLTYILKEGLIVELRMWGLNLEKVSDIDGIEILNALRVLDLSGNNLREIDGLETITSLEILKFGDLNYSTGNQITEIKGLTLLKNLRVLNLSNNYIKEIKGLDNLINLKRLYLVNNSIKEIKGLDTLQNLIYLNLEKNSITQIQRLKELILLEILVLGKNSIVKVSNIQDLHNLREIRIQGNPISEIEPVEFKNEIEIKLYSSEIERMDWLNSITGIKIKSVETVKPTEYVSRYLQ
ncbi:MAG: hypothetical protein HWN80_12965 [Candidatus Lokiarchaeota archaeon]|nr:hypothetical protein [Candidatus Lokiarchaeota archaeon]